MDAMYLISSRYSWSEQSKHMPFGGMAFRPFFTDAMRPSIPFSRRGAHAASSPIFGAPATPWAWQTAQLLLYFSMFGAAAADMAKAASAAVSKTFFTLHLPMNVAGRCKVGTASDSALHPSFEGATV
jgi:hypothetical protein